jgi:hypothetical protein
MRTRLLPWTLAAVLAASLAPASAADTPHARLIESRSPTVVTVKAALKINGSFMGRTIDQEREMTTVGVVVDASGFVMIPASAVSVGRFGRMMGGEQPDIKVTPTNLRVIFAGDEKEYEAILGATDSKLGLAFVLIRDLQGRPTTCIDFSKTAEPKVGETLYAITRLGQGFDYAPVCQEARVVGQVTKPRTMWVLQGPGADVPHPLYNADGAVTGIVVTQEGVGDEGSASRPFLLPLKIATGTIDRALKTSQKALEEANAAAASAPKEGEKKPGEGDDGKPKPDGD